MSDLDPAVAAWLRKAQNDLKNIRASLQSDDPAWDTVCYHAQQAAEKSLKAFTTVKRNLQWQPPSGFAPPYVNVFMAKKKFDVVRLSCVARRCRLARPASKLHCLTARATTFGAGFSCSARGRLVA
ncbi:MAG: HEPN domain-containing protein [Verrucomicrobia bacterium]|nr:HEPN domain-containing protein [Verrucomicrobiota bacterium]